MRSEENDVQKPTPLFATPRISIALLPVQTYPRSCLLRSRRPSFMVKPWLEFCPFGHPHQVTKWAEFLPWPYSYAVNKSVNDTLGFD